MILHSPHPCPDRSRAFPRRATALCCAPAARHASRGAAALAGLLAALALAAAPATAHPGALDDFGGHIDERTGEYHYHHYRPSKDIDELKREYLQWVHFPVQGTIRGKVVSIGGAAMMWLFVDYRPAYQDLAQHLAKENRDDRKELLRVDLAHVSPEETGARNPRFEEWFLGKVTHELKLKLLEQDVTVNFYIVGGSASRLRGMVFIGKESVNLWLVHNGWSYYMLGDPDTEYEKRFRDAEGIARRDKAGIWQIR